MNICNIPCTVSETRPVFRTHTFLSLTLPQVCHMQNGNNLFVLYRELGNQASLHMKMLCKQILMRKHFIFIRISFLCVLPFIFKLAYH
jgi:hypothetical protein